MTDLLSKAKIGLMREKSVFIMSVVLSLEHKFNPDIPTARTNGLTVEYNPTFFESLTPRQRIFLVGHEAWHVALKHILRRGDKDSKLWNYAGDYVINLMQVNNGMEMPDVGLIDYRFKNMSTEEVYKYLKDNSITPPDVPLDLDFSNSNAVPDKQLLEKQIDRIIMRAATTSKLAGEKPGKYGAELTKILKTLVEPKLPWTELLSRFVSGISQDDYTTRKFNRFFFPEFYLPSLYKEAIDNITIAIDTSGSIREPQLQQILSEIKYLYNTTQPKKLTVLDCDRNIHNIYECDPDTNITDLKFSGGGGTSFIPVIDYCKKHPPTALIYFTDLHAQQIQKDPGFPIMWVCYSNAKPAPIGETIYYD